MNLIEVLFMHGSSNMSCMKIFEKGLKPFVHGCTFTSWATNH